MFSAPTRHVANARPSCDSPQWAVIPHQTPEYQCLWFQFYRASNFYCMAIAAKLSSPSGPPSAADWAAVSIAAALETRVDATVVIASAAVAIAITNDDDHPREGHKVNDCLHDGCEDVIVDNGPPFLLLLSNDDKGNAFLTRHAPSNADAQSPERQCHRGQSREEIRERQQRVLRGIGPREQDEGHGGGDDGGPARYQTRRRPMTSKRVTMGPP
jgi:hypothetical protein